MDCYWKTDYKGIIGIEKYFEKTLKGELGNKNLMKNINGFLYENPYKESIKPDPGKNITLTLDMQLQEILQDELLKTIENIKLILLNILIQKKLHFLIKN